MAAQIVGQAVPAVAAAETAAEVLIDTARTKGATGQQKADAAVQLVIQSIEAAEGFEGRELVQDANVQLLIKGVNDSVHALMAGLLAKKAATSPAPVGTQK